MINKRCLLITPGNSVFKQPLQEAFERAGFNVHPVDCRGHVLLSDSLGRRLLGRLPKVFRDRGQQYALGQINKKILHIAQELRPDIIFVMKGKELSGEALDAMNKIAQTANWYPETVDHWGGIQEAAPHFAYFFAFDELVVERLKERGHPNAHYLPFCADVHTSELWPQESLELKYGVTFVGTYHPERAEREHILAKVADLGLHVWGGPGWEKTSLARYYRGEIGNTEMLDVYRSSHIVINHYLINVPGSGINLRPFEVTGAGALLVNHNARSDIFRHFQDGEEFISFSGADDIRDKVTYYLEHEQERRRIAKNGFLRTQREHTYDIRIAEVLRIMNLL